MYYYKHHIGDFRSGTSNMTRHERWLYRDMLDFYYDKELPLPLDMQDVCDNIGATEEEAKSVAKILRLKFNQSETGWVHERCEIELDAYRANAEKARNNGKLGGRPPKKTQPVSSGMQAGSKMEPTSNPEESGSKANHKPLTTNQEPITNTVKTIVEPTASTRVSSIEVEAVFQYWQNQRGHERAKLDDKRSKAIKARIKDGYSVEDICRAVDGVSKSSYHMGQNDSRTVYDDIELICRSAANVDKFRKLAEPQQFTDPGLQRQVDVLRAWMEDVE